MASEVATSALPPRRPLPAVPSRAISAASAPTWSRALRPTRAAAISPETDPTARLTSKPPKRTPPSRRSSAPPARGAPVGGSARPPRAGRRAGGRDPTPDGAAQEPHLRLDRRAPARIPDTPPFNRNDLGADAHRAAARSPTPWTPASPVGPPRESQTRRPLTAMISAPSLIVQPPALQSPRPSWQARPKA